MVEQGILSEKDSLVLCFETYVKYAKQHELIQGWVGVWTGGVISLESWVGAKLEPILPNEVKITVKTEKWAI